MYKHNFVIFGSKWDLYKFAFSDIYGMDNVKYFALSGLKHNLFAFIKRLQQHYPTSSILSRIWIKLFPKIDFTTSKPIIFIYMWGVLTNNATSKAIEYLRKKYKNSKHILFNTDLIATRNSTYTAQDAKRDYDLVLSFDPGDCIKYDFVYHPLVFSKYKLHNLPIEYDIVFIGQGKNRLQEIFASYDFFVSKGLNVKYVLIHIPKDQRRFVAGIEYVDSIPYLKNLQYVEQSKCILEIMQKSGMGYTQRGCEIVGLNKKLITNNSFIANAPFYNAKYISVFTSVNNIDLDFIEHLKNNEIVEYGDEQRDRMSPKELLSFVEKHIS